VAATAQNTALSALLSLQARRKTWRSPFKCRALERLPKRAYTPPVKLSRLELIITIKHAVTVALG